MTIEPWDFREYDLDGPVGGDDMLPFEDDYLMLDDEPTIAEMEGFAPDDDPFYDLDDLDGDTIDEY